MPTSRPTDTGRPDTGQRVQTGKTTANAAQKRLPRLPHEHDESADSQDQQRPEQDEVIQQAHDDIERGLVDTDRGAVTDNVYREQQKSPRP